MNIFTGDLVTQMTRTGATLFVAGLLVAALPLAFGVIRAATTRTDFRYLEAALAALAGAAAITARGASGRFSARRLLLSLAIGTLLAAATAFLVGARSPGAVLAVALAFSGCATVGCALVMRARAG